MKIAFKKLKKLVKESIKKESMTNRYDEVDAEAELVKLAEDNVITWESIARGCLAFMSDDQIRNMAFDEGLLEGAPIDMSY